MFTRCSNRPAPFSLPPRHRPRASIAAWWAPTKRSNRHEATKRSNRSGPTSALLRRYQYPGKASNR